MEYPSSPARMHPLIAGAAGSVIVVSLLGIAAITGVIPASHGSAVQSSTAPASLPAAASTAMAVPAANPAMATRYVTSDGQVLEVVPNTLRVAPARMSTTTRVEHIYEPAPIVRHKVVHHYAQNSYTQPTQPVRTAYETPEPQAQPYNAPQQHPVRNYVSDMHPVGTGVGAVVGGLLGNQVGGGDGKKLATVAGALLGGYAGNEISHNRSPVPW